MQGGLIQGAKIGGDAMRLPVDAHVHVMPSPAEVHSEVPISGYLPAAPALLRFPAAQQHAVWRDPGGTCW